MKKQKKITSFLASLLLVLSLVMPGTYPEGTIRFSFGPENTAEEIDLAIKALKEICQL